MTSDDAAAVREMLATMAAEKPHWQCPDDWKDCNEAREDVPRLVAALERAVAWIALAETGCEWTGTASAGRCEQGLYRCDSCSARKTLAGIRKDLEGRS